jgi:glutathione S-transferase
MDRQFLVGNAFSRADLTACSLLQPYVRPCQSDADAARILPNALMQLRDQHRGRRFFRWVQNVYDNYRQPMHAETRAAA